MLLSLQRFGKRFVLMIGGEALQSAFHFGLNITLVHVLSTLDYGIFAIVMVIGGVALTYIRALTAMPASIWIGQSRSLRAASAYDVTFGSGATLLSAFMAIIVVVILQLWLGSHALVSGLFVGLWSLRSHLRTALFASSRQVPVALGDFVYMACGAGLTVLLLLLSTANILRDTFVVLALANALGIAAMLVAAGRSVRISFRRRIRNRYAAQWRQLGWSSISVTTANLQGQGTALLVAAIAGPAAYAPIAAALVLFVPLRIVGSALMNLMQPIVAAHLSRGEVRKVWTQALTWSAIMVCGSLIYAGAIMSILPLLQIRVFEATSVHVVGFFSWAIYTAFLLYTMPKGILEVLNAFRSIAVITAISAAVGIATVALLLIVATPAWAMAGAALSEMIVMAACWITVRNIFFVTPADPANPRFSLFGQTPPRPVGRLESSLP